MQVTDNTVAGVAAKGSVKPINRYTGKNSFLNLSCECCMFHPVVCSVFPLVQCDPLLLC